MSYRVFMSAAIVLILGNCGQAMDISVTTPSGDRVILRDDGTWVYDATEIPESLKTGDPHFRESHWGDSKETVKSSESARLQSEQERVLLYSVRLAGMDALAAYIFVPGKLVRAKYILRTTHTNRNDYLTDFSKLQDLLDKKYGKPTEEQTLWKDDLYRSNPSRWGMAVATGDLSKFTSWKTSDTDIILALIGDNYEITLAIEYTSTRFQDFEELLTETETLEDL